MSRPETITSEYVRGFRAGESSALERASQDFDAEAERLEQDARKFDADGQGMAAAANFHYARVAEANANRIRALASPAAAPATETAQQENRRFSTWTGPTGKQATTEEWLCPDCGGWHVVGLGGIRVGHPCPRTQPPAPPSEPVAPSLLPRAATTDKVRIAQLNTQLDNAEKRIAELETALRALTSVNRAVSEVEGLAAARSEGES